jgi:formylglycine-generating enzyme required for sulfatase activity
LIQRWDGSEIEHLTSYIADHPYNEIRKWLQQQSHRKRQAVIYASRGGYELVRIPAGSFMMGSEEYDDEKPVHEVHISEFYLGRYPVTNEEYERYMAADPGVPEPEYWGDRQFNRPRQPVVGVSWDDAVKYAEWAGLQLPTEAQWEYACRAGTTTRYYTGDTEEDLDRAGWYTDNSDYKLHPVGEKEPNPWGVYDMHGNVWEWCHDWFDENYYADSPSIDPTGPDTGAYRVIRGGSFNLDAARCRSALRRRFSPAGYRCDRLGFRVVSLPGQQPSK